MTRVLIVDDEPAVRAALDRALRLDGYEITLAADGREALDSLADARHDAVVLDVAMPGIDGLQVCRRLRDAGDRTPVLMLTARDAVDDRVAGLDAGADDYLVKPFALKELKARLRALLRRAEAPESEDGSVLRFADLSLDRGAWEARSRPAQARAQPHRVPAAGAVPRAPEAGADALADLRARLGLRLRLELELARRLHGLPAPQDGGGRRAAPPAHRARRGLRAERLMRSLPLRRRMTIAVALAVAVAVALAAAVAYIAVRDQLISEVDRALQDQRRVRLRAATARRGGDGPPRFRRAARAAAAARRRSSRCSTPSGDVLAQLGLERQALPVDDRARDVAAGVGPEFFSRRGRRRHARARAHDPGRPRLRLPGPPARRVPVRPLARGRRRRAGAPAADPRARVLGGVALAVALGRLVSRNVVAPIAHVTEAARHIAATEDLGRRIEVETHDEVGELAAALQRDARHARALGRRPAPARRRRLARAAHADHQPAHQHRGAGRVRVAAAGRARAAAARTSRSRRPSSGCSSPT